MDSNRSPDQRPYTRMPRDDSHVAVDLSSQANLDHDDQRDLRARSGISSPTLYLRFAYNCFIKPFLTKKANGLDSSAHQDRLEAFYAGQADIYDDTRSRLLRGRSTMLKLCASELSKKFPTHFNELATRPERRKRYAWIDVGGGTGYNVELMNQFMPISNFDKVYMVDITPSLCKVAEERFRRLGWTNVSVICMDASKFTIPEEDGPEDLEIALMTMSYSLSMIEQFYPVVDGLVNVLSPNGIFGVADFYVSSKRSADPARQLSWLSRWFWAIWFDADNIYLHPCRRDYLEHKFKTIITLSKKNWGMVPLFGIPYYVWIGIQKGADELPTNTQTRDNVVASLI